MKILIPDWKSFGKKDIETTLRSMGHEIIYYAKEPRSYRRDPRFRSELRRFIREKQVDVIFSSNYFPILSVLCRELKIPYISWCYDCPLVLTYSDTIWNSCNYIFLFDSQMVYDLRQQGVEHAWYLPMAVNPKRLDSLHASPEQFSLLKADVSFVGSLYNEKHNLYDRLSTVDPYVKGYLEGIMAAQREVYGYYFLERTLTPDIIRSLRQAAPLEPNPDGHETLSYLYANYFLCRKITQTERMDILTLLDHRTDLDTRLYTPEPTPQYTHIQNMGTVHYDQEMPLVFRHTKINLNITLRSIQNGIPLRAMDILGAGGFLLTDHQNDFTRHFTEGEDHVCYENTADLMDKISYYLKNENERKAIAANGKKKVSEEHTYEKRFHEIFAVTGLA